jgi:protoporphyrinogen oxidase
MKASHSSHVVVGAGLPGIAASLALAKRGLDVVLLDSAPEIGGLLRSYEVDGPASANWMTCFSAASSPNGLNSLPYAPGIGGTGCSMKRTTIPT